MPVFRDLFAIAEAEALFRNPLLLREELERPGSDVNILLASAAAAAEEVIGQLARVQQGLFLSTARREQLDKLVYDRYGLLRKQAAPSYGYANFTTTAATAGAFTIPDATVLGTSAGLQFITIGAVTFPAGSTGPVRVPIRSVAAGADQKARAGTVTAIQTEIVNQPTDLAVTNPAATFGGEDAELDEAFVARVRLFYTTVRRGTVSAIRLGALSVAAVASASVFESVDGLGRPSGYVEVAIADSFTDQFVGAAVPPTYATQMAALSGNIEAALEEYRPAGVPVAVTIGSIVLTAVRLALSFNAGVDTTAVSLAARSAVVNRVNRLAPGERLTVTSLRETVQAVTGISPTGSEIVAPAGDVVPLSLQVLRTQLSLVGVI